MNALPTLARQRERRLAAEKSITDGSNDHRADEEPDLE
jgi:hypothetical protein